MKDFAKSIRTGNSVPGSWRRIMLDGPAQQKDYKNYSIYVQEDKDEERGKTWWSWYVYKGDYEVAGGETNSEGSAKAAAESRLEGFLSRTGNSKVGNMRIDVVFRGHALTDDALRKLTPAEISELKREYESMLRDGAIDRSEYNETMDEIRRVRAGNSKIGNADYSRASDQDLKNWIRMMEQDIRNYEKEAKKYEWYGKNEKGTYGASQYNHAVDEINEAKSNIKRMQEELRKRGVGNSKIGNSFESAKSEYEKAVREIESELKSAKPNIDKYFQIKERISRTLSSERNNIQKELSAKISELIDMDSNISHLEDKFYK